MRNRVGFLLVAIVAIAFGACSTDDETRDDDGGGGGSVNTGVPGDTMANAMTQEQLNQSCEAFQTYLENRISDQQFHDFECTLTGIFTAQLAGGDCETARAECLEEPPEVDEDECNPAEPLPEDCNVTVAELERCIVAQLALTEELVTSVNCGMADDPNAMDQFDQEPPPECAGVEQNCPSFFDDDEEE